MCFFVTLVDAASFLKSLAQAVSVNFCGVQLQALSAIFECFDSSLLRKKYGSIILSYARFSLHSCYIFLVSTALFKGL